MVGQDISSLSVEQKIGQLLFVGLSGSDFDRATVGMLGEIQPGGVCLFARNIKGLRQTRDLLDSIFGVLPIPPLLSLDQEGGRVDRLRRVLSPMPAASRLRDADDARRLGELIGETISLLGFNMDFAPVVDVIEGARREFSNGLESRGFGRTKFDVVEMANAFILGLERYNILGCLKHFPGLAAAQVDSHEELPVVPIDTDELYSVDLYPYKQLLTQNSKLSVMVAHAAYPRTRLQEMDDSGNLLPSSLNGRIVKALLRDELQFTGVAITDDMEMGAIVRKYGIGDASKLAVQAGVDMIAICASEDSIRAAYRALVDAVDSGELTIERIDASIRRIKALKDHFTDRPEYDEARFGELADEITALGEELS